MLLPVERKRLDDQGVEDRLQMLSGQDQNGLSHRHSHLGGGLVRSNIGQKPFINN